MSKTGKILLFVALAGALVSIVLGYLKIQAFNSQKAELTASQNDVAVQKVKVKTANEAAEAAKTAETQAETDLTASKSTVTDLTSKLADATKQQTDLQAQVQTAQDDTKKAQDELARVQKALGGAAPEEVMAKVDKLTEQVAADNAAQKILEDKLQAASEQVAQLHKDINSIGKPTSTLPPGISGKVTFVNTAWNFVVINVGLSNGVVPNGELVIYRGRDFLGKVKVTSAEDNTAVGDILPGAKGAIQVGDDVLN